MNDIQFDENLEKLFHQFIQEHPELMAEEEEFSRKYIQDLLDEGIIQPKPGDNQEADAEFYTWHLSFDQASEVGFRVWDSFQQWLKEQSLGSED